MEKTREIGWWKKFVNFEIDTGFTLWLASRNLLTKHVNPINKNMKELVKLAKEFDEYLKTK